MVAMTSSNGTGTIAAIAHRAAPMMAAENKGTTPEQPANAKTIQQAEGKTKVNAKTATNRGTIVTNNGTMAVIVISAMINGMINEMINEMNNARNSVTISVMNNARNSATTNATTNASHNANRSVLMPS